MCILLLDGMFFLSVRSTWSIVVQVHCFLIFCLHGLSTVEKRRIKVPPITVLWFISPFSSASICVIYLGVPMVSAEVISP